MAAVPMAVVPSSLTLGFGHGLLQFSSPSRSVFAFDPSKSWHLRGDSWFQLLNAPFSQLQA